MEILNIVNSIPVIIEVGKDCYLLKCGMSFVICMLILE